jgi:hypothetical protein
MKALIFFIILAALAFYCIPQPFNLVGMLVVAAAGIASF